MKKKKIQKSWGEKKNGDGIQASPGHPRDFFQPPPPIMHDNEFFATFGIQII